MRSKIDMPKMLSEVKSKYSFTCDFEKAVKLMVLNQLIAVKSRLGLEEWDTTSILNYHRWVASE